MKKASEMKELANKYPNGEKINLIEAEIETAAQEGMKHVTIYSHYSDEVIKELEDNGYKVSFKTEYIACLPLEMMTISWEDA